MRWHDATAMSRASPERITIAVLAKAPVPGFAKTRLIPALGAHAAAFLQERLTEQAIATACEAAIGRVVLWGAPDITHPAFRALAAMHRVRLARQPDGDLGARMLAAFEAAGGPLVLIGSDCPALGPEDLREAAAALACADVVIAPAEDGGYGLIAARRPHTPLFADMPWSTAAVADRTRARAAAAGLVLHELRTIWDVDTAADYDRAVRAGLL